MNNLENKGKGKNIAIIVLSIILIIVLGFICYDKLLKKEPIVNKEKNCPKCQECNNNKRWIKEVQNTKILIKEGGTVIHLNIKIFKEDICMAAYGNKQHYYKCYKEEHTFNIFIKFK